MILSPSVLLERRSVDDPLPHERNNNRKYHPKKIFLNLNPSVLKENFIIRLFPSLELLTNEYNKGRNACIFYI